MIVPGLNARRGGSTLAVIVAVVFLLAAAAAPLYLPTVASDDDRLATELREGAERVAARLADVSANLITLSELRRQLEAAQVELTADALSKLASENAESLSEVEEQVAATATLLANVQRKYPDVGTGRPSTGIGGRGAYGQVARATVNELRSLIQANQSGLDLAEREVRALVGKTVGSASARNDVGVNQLGALVAYQRSLIEGNHAELLRREAESDRATARMLLWQVAELRRVSESVAKRAPTQAVKQTQAVIGGLEASVGRLEAEYKLLEALVKRTSEEVNALRATAREQERALAELDGSRRAIRGRSDFESFRRKYDEVSKAMRAADARAERLENEFADADGLAIEPGGLLAAIPRIDGKLPGLVTLRARLVGARETVDATSRMLDAKRTELERLTATAATLEKQAKAVNDAVAAAFQTVDALVERAGKQSSAARETEDRAIKHADAATQFISTALGALQKRVNEARQQVSAAAGKPNERLNLIVSDKDNEASLRFLAAQIASAAAEVYLARIQDATEMDALESLRVSLGGARQSEPHADVIAEARTNALTRLDKAVAELTSADNAVKGASHSVGTTRVQGANYRWQFQGALAAVHLLRSQIVDPETDLDEMNAQRAKAYELLTEAVKGREGSPLLTPAVDLVLYLQQSSK